MTIWLSILGRAAHKYPRKILFEFLYLLCTFLWIFESLTDYWDFKEFGNQKKNLNQSTGPIQPTVGHAAWLGLGRPSGSGCFQPECGWRSRPWHRPARWPGHTDAAGSKAERRRHREQEEDIGVPFCSSGGCGTHLRRWRRRWGAPDEEGGDTCTGKRWEASS
jgi:hypothetical protein